VALTSAQLNNNGTTNFQVQFEVKVGQAWPSNNKKWVASPAIRLVTQTLTGVTTGAGDQPIFLLRWNLPTHDGGSIMDHSASPPDRIIRHCEIEAAQCRSIPNI
jgi:hypothetical protein